MSKKKTKSKQPRKPSTSRRTARHARSTDLKDFVQFPEAAAAELSPKSLTAVYTTSTLLHKALKRLADK